MKRVVLILIFGFLAMQGLIKYQKHRDQAAAAEKTVVEEQAQPIPLPTPTQKTELPPPEPQPKPRAEEPYPYYGPSSPSPTRSEPKVQSSSFRCDGRVYCSQMSSCEEATYFLQHCPGVKMDGNHDGVPCEQQWCK